MLILSEKSSCVNLVRKKLSTQTWQEKIPASSNSSAPPMLTDRTSLNWLWTRKRKFWIISFILGMLAFLWQNIKCINEIKASSIGSLSSSSWRSEGSHDEEDNYNELVVQVGNIVSDWKYYRLANCMKLQLVYIYNGTSYHLKIQLGATSCRGGGFAVPRKLTFQVGRRHLRNMMLIFELMSKMTTVTTYFLLCLFLWRLI